MKPFSSLPEAHQQRIPPEQLERLQSALLSLESALLAKDPLMPQHLAASHRVLVSYPETVHLLDDTEIAKIIEAQQQHTVTRIVNDVAKGKSTGGKKKLSVDDL